MKPLFYLLALLAAVSAAPATAQKIVERQETIAAGQRVVLNLRQADHIRVRAGKAGQLTLKATVSINQNQLNDAYLLDVDRAGNELQVSADLDKEKLRTATPGNCPDGQGSHYGSTWTNTENGKTTRNGVCVAIDYDITVPPGVDLRVSTISGDISLTGLQGAVQAKSISGDVDLTWPRTKGAELALKTISGEVYADPAVAFSNRRDNPVVGYEVHGTWQGGGGPAVKLESISGDVFFRQQP